LELNLGFLSTSALVLLQTSRPCCSERLSPLCCWSSIIYWGSRLLACKSFLVQFGRFHDHRHHKCSKLLAGMVWYSKLLALEPCKWLGIQSCQKWDSLRVYALSWRWGQERLQLSLREYEWDKGKIVKKVTISGIVRLGYGPRDHRCCFHLNWQDSFFVDWAINHHRHLCHQDFNYYFYQALDYQFA